MPTLSTSMKPSKDIHNPHPINHAIKSVKYQNT